MKNRTWMMAITAAICGAILTVAPAHAKDKPNESKPDVNVPKRVVILPIAGTEPTAREIESGKFYLVHHNGKTSRVRVSIEALIPKEFKPKKENIEVERIDDDDIDVLKVGEVVRVFNPHGKLPQGYAYFVVALATSSTGRQSGKQTLLKTGAVCSMCHEEVSTAPNTNHNCKGRKTSYLLETLTPFLPLLGAGSTSTHDNKKTVTYCPHCHRDIDPKAANALNTNYN